MRAREETISHEGVKTEKQAACFACFASLVSSSLIAAWWCVRRKSKKAACFKAVRGHPTRRDFFCQPECGSIWFGYGKFGIILLKWAHQAYMGIGQGQMIGDIPPIKVAVYFWRRHMSRSYRTSIVPLLKPDLHSTKWGHIGSSRSSVYWIFLVFIQDNIFYCTYFNKWLLRNMHMHKKILRCTFHLHLFMRSVDSKYGDIIAVPLKILVSLGKKLMDKKEWPELLGEKREKRMNE